MDHAGFQRWLDDYIDAWRTYDPEAIGALFSDDAQYRWHPWDEGEEAVEGRDAIVAAWLGDRDEPGSWNAEYRPWAIDGDRAVAVGVSRYVAREGEPGREYHNVFLCRFDDDGRCREFTEHFMERKQPREG
jgi:ketosteroid isomerase-like protein